MKAVGFITDKSRVRFIPEDEMISDALRENGVMVFPIPWDEFDANSFEKLDMAVFRTPWNYHLQLPKFLEWLKSLHRSKVPLFNSAATVIWNLDIHYLRDLEQKGAPIVPTLFFKRTDFNLEMKWPESPTGQYVLKPTISASAHRTFKGDRILLTDILFEEDYYTSNESLMLQPFITSVQSEGELSFLFFNGEFSHCVSQKPKPNDFRVQEEFGGTMTDVEPNAMMLQQAQQVLDALGTRPLYARVDMVNWDGKLHLMELELFEPMFYIRKKEHAENFARALISRLPEVRQSR